MRWISTIISQNKRYKSFLFVLFTLSLMHTSLLYFIHFLYYMSTIITMNFNNFFVKQQFISILTHKNCNQWFILMKRWLIKEDLWNVVEILAVNTSVSKFLAVFFLSNLDFRSQKTDIKTLYWFTICINVDNQEYLMNKISTKNVWNVLKFKYKKKLQTTERQYLTEFVEYKMSENMFIKEVWIYLSKLSRKITATQSDIIRLFKSEQQFQTLL